jgi:hypothetical protein
MRRMFRSTTPIRASRQFLEAAWTALSISSRWERIRSTSQPPYSRIVPRIPGSRSRHQLASQVSTCAGVTCGFWLNAACGPPGAICMSVKLTIDTRKRTGIAWSARRMMYLVMALASWPADGVARGARRRVHPPRGASGQLLWNQSSTSQVGPTALGA